MIARLQGQLLEVTPPSLVIDVSGVGYQVDVPMSVFDQLPALGESVTLLTEMIIRDDAHTLYGFQSAADRQLFRDLLKVSGVGPRLALGVLSGVSGPDFALMIDSKDSQALTRLPGIGKKTAERLIVEMQGRINSGDSDGATPSLAANDASQEARQALTSLGYSQAESLKMVRQAQGELPEDANAQHLIKHALKQKMSP
jgi:Holliday junction DNA helicase RuvA